MDTKHTMDKKIEKNRWSIRNILLYGLAGAALIFLASAMLRGAGKSRLNVKQERIMLDTIHTGVFQEFITVFGDVEPIKTVFLDAVESGRVEEVVLESGELVNEGQKILRLSNRDLQLSVLNQEAQIITQINNLRNLSVMMEQQSLNLKETALDIDFQLDLLQKRTQRNEDLYKDNVIARVEYEDTRDEFNHLKRRKVLLRQTIKKDSLSQEIQKEQMESSLDLMKRNLNFARTSLESLNIKAPIKGQVSSLNAEIGQMITRGQRIAQIDVLDEFKIQATVDEFYINRVNLNLVGTISFDGKTHQVKVHRIYPEVENGSFLVDLLFVEQMPSKIKRGQNLPVKLSLSAESEGLLLAKGGHYQTTGGNWVYVMNPDNNTAQKREIRIGRQNPNFYEVRDGLYPGDIVIISSYDSFGDKDELVIQ